MRFLIILIILAQYTPLACEDEILPLEDNGHLEIILDDEECCDPSCQCFCCSFLNIYYSKTGSSVYISALLCADEFPKTKIKEFKTIPWQPPKHFS